MNFAEEFRVRRENIEKGLAQKLKTLEGAIPEGLYQSMEYSLLAGGKRIRPILLMETASLGPSSSKAQPLALALEMIHTYSLVHDDLPAMDNDDMRRGKPTNHIQFGEPTAILAGDALLNFAYETIFDGLPDSASVGYLKAAALIARSAGPMGMVGGQADDVANEGQIHCIETLESINIRKTGALIKASVVGGALHAGLDQNQLIHLEKYSETIGLAFQIVDDILDVTGDAQRMGKGTGNDQENNKITYPEYYGLDRAKEIVDTLYEESLERLRQARANTPFLLELTGFLCQRDH